MSGPGHGPAGLTALLDALEAELVIASTEEVHDALRETGRARDVVCREIRSLLADAMVAGEEDPVTTPPFDAAIRNGLHRH